MKRVTIQASPRLQARVEARANASLNTLINATPAQIDTWLSSNVTSLAEARNALKVILLGLRYLLRKDAEAGQ